MRYFALLCLFIASVSVASAQPDTLPPAAPLTDSLTEAMVPLDTLLTAVRWEETTTGTRNGYLLRLDEFGPFEEDAGERYSRHARYLMGQWTVDTALTRLTLAVDYFLGEKMVDRRYREGNDFYLRYQIVSLTPDALELKDEKTGQLRTFTARPLGSAPDAATRTATEIDLGRKKKGGLEIPKGW